MDEEFEECKQDYYDSLDEGQEPDDSFWFSWVAWVMSMTMRKHEPEPEPEVSRDTKYPWED